MTTKEFLISIKDDDDIWPNMQAECDQLLRLRDVPFKCTALSATRMIEVSVTLIATKGSGLSSETGAINWQRMPFVSVYVFKCEDSDAYKSGLSSLKQWIELMNEKSQEWLVLYFPQGSSTSTFSTTSAKYRKVWEKLRGDIKPADRLCKHDLNSGKATEFVNRVRDALVASIDARISLYEKATGAMLALGRQSDDWCPSHWILAKDTIAQIFERLGLTSQALSVLDEISTVVDNPVADISIKFPSLVRDHSSLKLLESNPIFFRELFKSDQASEADARHYLFSRRFSLLANLHRPADAASLSARLCRFFFKRLFMLLPSKSAGTNPLFPFSWAIELCDAVSVHLVGSTSSGAEDSHSKQAAIICAELLLFSRELLCTFKPLVEHSDSSQSSLPAEPTAVREIEYARSHELLTLVKERCVQCSPSAQTQVPTQPFDDDENKVPSEFTHRLPLKPSIFVPNVGSPSDFKEHAATLGIGLLASALSSKQALQRTICEVGLRAAYFLRMAGRYRSVCLLYKEIGEDMCPIDAGIGTALLSSCMNVWIHEGWVLPILSTYPSLFDSYKKLQMLQPLADMCVKLLSSRFHVPPALSLSFQSELIECVTSFNAIPMVTSLPDVFQISPSRAARDEHVVGASEKCHFSFSIDSHAVGKFPIDFVSISFALLVPVQLSPPVMPSFPSSPSKITTSTPSSPATLSPAPRPASEIYRVASDSSDQIILSVADIELSPGYNHCIISGIFPSSGVFAASSVTLQIGALKMMMPLQNQVPPFLINVSQEKITASISFASPENVCAGFWNALCVEVCAGVLEEVSCSLQLKADGCEFFSTGLIAPGPLSSYSNSAQCIASSASRKIANFSRSSDGTASLRLSSMSKAERVSICVCFKTLNTGPCSVVATLNASTDEIIAFSATNQYDINVIDCVSAEATVSQVNQSIFVSVVLQSRQVSVDLISSSIEVPACFSVVSNLSAGSNTRPLLPGQLLGLGAQIGWKREGISVGGSDCSGRIVLRLMPVHDMRKAFGLLKDESEGADEDDFTEDFNESDAIGYCQIIELPCVTSTVVADVVAPPLSAFGRQVSIFNCVVICFERSHFVFSLLHMTVSIQTTREEGEVKGTVVGHIWLTLSPFLYIFSFSFVASRSVFFFYVFFNQNIS